MVVESWAGGAVVVEEVAWDNGGTQAMSEWRSTAVHTIGRQWWGAMMAEDGGMRAMVGGSGPA